MLVPVLRAYQCTQYQVTAFAVALELFILLFFVYVPGVQSFMGMAAPLRFSWIPWLGVAFVLLLYTESLLLYTRRKQRVDAVLLQERETQVDDDSQQRIVQFHEAPISASTTPTKSGALMSIV